MVNKFGNAGLNKVSKSHYHGTARRLYCTMVLVELQEWVNKQHLPNLLDHGTLV